MKPVLDNNLIYEILSVVGEIPEGRVATYGQIARLVGREKTQGSLEKSSVTRRTTGNTPAIVW